MSNIPQLMSGRSLEHDLKFSSNGPMSGLVDGVQSIEATGTVTLSFDESNTQITASVLAIEPDADRSVKLPANLTDAGLNLGGRKLTIFNSSPDLSKDLTIFESDGTTFVARVGFDSCVTIVFPAHGAPFCLNDLFVGTCTLPSAGTAAIAIADKVGAAYVIAPQILFLSGQGATSARTYQLQDEDDVKFAITASVDLDAAGFTALPIYNDGTAVLGATKFVANKDVEVIPGGAPGADVKCRLLYRVLKRDLSALS